MMTSLVLLSSLALTGTALDEDFLGIDRTLAAQHAAWEDLTVDYTCEVLARDAHGKLFPDHRKKLHSATTKKGWEKFVRITPEALLTDAKKRDWVEAESFNGEYYTAYDSQQNGSGGFGHAGGNFINNGYSVKRFGLCIAGLEVNEPVSIARFLSMKQTQAKVTQSTSDAVVVEGRDPFAEGVRYKLWLNPKEGYQPARIEQRDGRGLLSMVEVRYRRLKGCRGEFWFPEKGTWYGRDPASRAPGNEMRYSLDRVQVDTRPSRATFVLTYPAGALLINYDTRQSYITTAATTPADVPQFAGKLITLQEHQEQQRKKKPAPDASSATRVFGAFWPWLVCNLVVLSAAACYINRKRIIKAQK
jgi:hypothetical protein